MTMSPAAPLVGLKLVILGRTVKRDDNDPLPAALTTRIWPVTAPAGTLTFSELAVTELGTALTPEGTVPSEANTTSLAPSRFVPPMVTSASTAAAAGATLSGCGGRITTKSAVLTPVPSIVVTAILPVVAPAGTVSSIIAGVLVS